MSNKEINVDQYDGRLAAVYSQNENKEQHYDEWAKTYDSDLLDDMEYVAFKDAGNIFAKNCSDKTSRILDVACGTGLAGQYLKELGFSNIDGADFSSEMLQVSQDRKVYEELWQHDFTKPKNLAIEYDALICVGMFSFSIPEISDMHHVVNCVKPSGLCIITVNGAAWTQLDLKQKLLEESARHKFTIEDIIKAEYIRKEGIDSRVLIIRR